MQDHRYSFEIDATPEEIWAVFWSPKTKGQVIEHGDVRIEILHPGDAIGEGLVRHCLISRDNDRFKQSIESGVRALRAHRKRQSV